MERQPGGAITELVQRIRGAAPCAAVLVLGPPDMQVRSLPTDPQPSPSGWRTPRRLQEIIEAERRAARASGAAFFDTNAAMGGEGVIDQWRQEQPPRSYGDHVHFTRNGYATLADLFLASLMQQYDAWTRAHPRGAGSVPAPACSTLGPP
ncbi:MAG: GDSL-type esterase/lipase family protein [Deltaproteobacteria bacterium]